eukprot:m.155481 g.155481  ORF g.155481 m.155481 type:complete len:449 (-) comp14407_c0_seq2:334-1680(-)
MFLPGARGFDSYLGIPYSDDNGAARRSPCPGDATNPCSNETTHMRPTPFKYTIEDNVHGTLENLAGLNANDISMLPLVMQTGGTTSTNGYAKNTTVLEQPLDFTTLPLKYNEYVMDFIEVNADEPFFLYMPFSHVHTTYHNQPQSQYASCLFQNSTTRGAFGDALADVDWIVGNVVAKLTSENILENTLILFIGDNGPWLTQGLSSGSAGIFVGRYSGYWNTGKGSTWEGGIREAAFAYWKGQISPGSRSSEVVSSLDLFPTVSALANVPLPTDRVYDGRSIVDVLLNDTAVSPHEVLFLYGGAVGGHDMLVAYRHNDPSDPGRFTIYYGPSAARMGCWKAMWGTGSGMGACTLGGGDHGSCPHVMYPLEVPLLFNVCIDPSEGIPLFGVGNGSLEAVVNNSLCGPRPWCQPTGPHLAPPSMHPTPDPAPSRCQKKRLLTLWQKLWLR